MKRLVKFNFEEVIEIENDLLGDILSTDGIEHTVKERLNGAMEEIKFYTLISHALAERKAGLGVNRFVALSGAEKCTECNADTMFAWYGTNGIRKAKCKPSCHTAKAAKLGVAETTMDILLKYLDDNEK